LKNDRAIEKVLSKSKGSLERKLQYWKDLKQCSLKAGDMLEDGSISSLHAQEEPPLLNNGSFGPVAQEVVNKITNNSKRNSFINYS